MQEAQQAVEAGAAAARQELAQYALESVAGVSALLAAATGHTAAGANTACLLQISHSQTPC